VKLLSDSLNTMHLILSDRTGYQKIDTNIIPAPNSAIFNSFVLASFITDEIFSEKFYITGIKDIVGANFFDLYGATLNKLNNSNWINFDLENEIDKEDRERVKKIVDFTSDYVKLEQSLEDNENMKSKGIPPPYRLMTYSRALDIPMFEPNFNNYSYRHNSKFVVAKELLEFELPTLKINSLDELIDVRNTNGAIQFRKIFDSFYRNHLSNDSIDDHGDLLKSWNDIKTAAYDILLEEFQKDISTWETMKASASVALNIAGFIPGVSLITGTIGTIKDSNELISQVMKKKKAENLAWLTFLSTIKKSYNG